MSFNLLRKLDNFLGPHTSRLASDMGEQYSKRPARYIYIPRQKLAIYWIHPCKASAVHFDLCVITQKPLHKFHSNLAHACIWTRRGTPFMDQTRGRSVFLAFIFFIIALGALGNHMLEV